MTASTGAVPAPAPATEPGYARRPTSGVSLGRLPMANLVIVEVGLGVALALLGVGAALRPVSGAVLGLASLLAGLRWRRRWLVEWISLRLAYQLRAHERTARPGAGPTEGQVTLLRLAVPDLVLARGSDHGRCPLGFAGHAGTWTAVLLVEPAPALVAPVGGSPNLPLTALAQCLEDRGVVLDSIQVVWHCYPCGTALPPSSPALTSYRQVLGPLPAAARRTTWVAVRLDPGQCASAVADRGGGVAGTHRALVGALSRVQSALATRGVPTRPLAPDELLRAGISAAGLTAVAGTRDLVTLHERWSDVSAGGVGHASYAVTGWGTSGTPRSLDALTGVPALSATVALSLSPTGDDGEVRLRGLVRVSARTLEELEQAEERLHALAERVGVRLAPLRGLQAVALAATLPLGGAA